MSLVGFLDDLRSRSVLLRLGLQVILCLGVSWTLVPNDDFRAATLLTLLCMTGWLVASVNVVNFMDGINGVTAAHGVIVGVTYWILLTETGGYWPLLAAALVGASLAFLPWNWGKKARAFLGDAGSYLLGAGFGLLAIGIWQSGYGILVAIAPVSIYWVDVMSTLARRVWRRKSPTSAHREHVYQRIVKSDYSHSSVALLVSCFSGFACAIALLAHSQIIGMFGAWAMLGALCLSYVLLPSVAQRWPRVSKSRTAS